MDAPRLNARWRTTVTRQCLSTMMLAIVLTSCSAASRDEMAHDVLKSDPGFKTVLDHRDAMQHQVDELRAQLEAKRMTAEQQIQAVQRELQDTRSRTHDQIEALTRELTPQREQLQLEIRTLTNHIRTQAATVQGLKRTLTDLERSQHRPATPPAMGQGRPLPPTGGVLETQLAATQRELQRTLSELSAAQTRRRLLQYKLRLLQLR